MTAEVLRKAAALMRERADLPWGLDSEWEANGIWVRRRSRNPKIGYPGHAEGTVSTFTEEDGGLNASERVATHIASWHPAVALAVADWLDHDAEVWEQYEKQGQGLPFARRQRSLAVARAYLGESS